MSEATTEITQAVTSTVTVAAEEVRAGDYVFDTFGRPDKVVRVHTTPKRGKTTITPAWLWPITLGRAETITIRRKEA